MKAIHHFIAQPLMCYSCKFTMALSIFVLVGLVACQNRLFSYNGALVREERRIMLDESTSDTGAWHAPDILLSYDYQRSGNQLTFKGNVRFTNRLAHGFRSVERFVLQLFSLDGEGRVLETRNLYVATFHQSLRDFSFKRSLTLPEGTRGIAFGYSGNVREGGQDKDSKSGGGSDMMFWDIPL